MIEKDNITVSISIGTITKTILLLLFFWGLYYLQDLVLVILASIVVASAIEPLTAWFIKWKIPRVPAVIIIYIFTILITFGLMGWFFPLVFDDFFKLVDTVPRYIKSINIDDYMSYGPASTINRFRDGIASSFTLEDLLPNVNEGTSGTSDNVVQTAKYFFGGIINFLLMMIISFYLAVQEKGIENFLRLVIHAKYEAYAIDLWKRSQRKIGFWMQGQVLLGLLIGVFVYLGLSILGVKYALALAIFASFFEIIPVFGPILAATPGIIVAFTQGTTLGIMTFGFYVIIQQFENHLIYPLVVRKVIGVPPLLVVVGIIVGLKVAGFWGAILSVPAAAVLMELVGDIEQQKRVFSEAEKV